MRKAKGIALVWLALAALAPSAQGQDTTRRAVTLPEVSVSTPNVRPEHLFVQTPTQVVAAAEMEKLGGALLSDAAKRLVGVTLKDYGGIGGVKTVSARGLGSQFSTLTIDGVAVNDCQNGQVDLGRYMLGNSSYISFAHGQGDSPLQSARALAAGSILNMETHEPEFGARPFNLGVGIEGGSFGYVNPSLSWEQRLGRRLSLSFWGNYMRSEGNYPFTLYYTNTHADSSSRERRENSQMWLGTADMNLFWRLDGRRRLHVKAHYMQGYHALPGPVVYYSVRGTEHSEEDLFFAQARYRQTGRHWDMQLAGKYQRSTDIYEDTAVHNAAHLVHNEYHQQEGYLSEVVRFHAGEKVDGHDPLAVSLSVDEALSALRSNLNHDSEVQRLSALGALAVEYLPRHLKGGRLNANLLGTWIRDYKPGSVGEPYAKLSPYAGFSWRRKGLTLRYFFKDTYRVPNFNELYYFTVGRSLRPEKARQHNVGASYKTPLRELDARHVVSGSATADLYLNHIDDKIIAIPIQNMFLWSMTNLGKVEVRGLDLTGSGTLKGLFEMNGSRRYDVVAEAGYSYQYAVDRTDPKSKNYGHQIPYTPRHSGHVALTATTPWVDVGFSAVLVGKRYCMHQNTPANLVKGYVDQGITFTREFDLGRGTLKARLQVLNLLNVQYEVVRSYPMMGRNYRVGLTWTL